MVLTRRRPLRHPALRWLRFAAAIALASLPALSGCGVPPADENGTGQNGKTPWGLRRDDSAFRARVPDTRPGDPCLAPSYKELREARAFALMETELQMTNGVTQYLSDGSSSDPGRVQFVAQPGALNFELSASDFLNNIDGQPHALTLVIYQLSDRVAFDQLAGSEEGMGKLLAGDYFDKGAVKAVRQFFIQPGMRNKVAMDRAENARHVAVVAGYHNPPDPAAYVRVFSYGIGRYATKGESVLHRDKYLFRPLPLNIRLELGDTAMSAGETGTIFQNLADSVTVRPAAYHRPLASAIRRSQ